MGLRIALGASPGQVLRLILGRGLAVTLPSLVVGTTTALVLSKVLAGVFRGVETVDPLILSMAAAALALVAMSACFMPARQAARVEPTVTLRSE